MMKLNKKRIRNNRIVEAVVGTVALVLGALVFGWAVLVGIERQTRADEIAARDRAEAQEWFSAHHDTAPHSCPRDM